MGASKVEISISTHQSQNKKKTKLKKDVNIRNINIILDILISENSHIIGLNINL
jgi:hypothetical protein